MAHAGNIQNFVGHKWIPVWADEPDTPTLWIYYDEQAPEMCEQYAEKIATLINQSGLTTQSTRTPIAAIGEGNEPEK